MKHHNPYQRLPRIAILALAAGAILGLGCVSIRLPPPQDDTAQKVYLPAAEKGDAQAQLQLALAYRYGTAGMSQDNKAAWEWLEKSARNGNREAQVMAADVLLRGQLGQAPNTQEGLQRLRAVAEQGHRSTQFYLASLLEEGRYGISPQLGEAARWYEAAARQGYRIAAQKLARLQETGQGVPRNPAAALAWYAVARNETEIKRLSPTLSPEQKTAASELMKKLQQEIQP